jgi:transposase
VIHGFELEDTGDSLAFLADQYESARLKPRLPNDTRSKPRLDDRLVISGIIHVLISGGRWIDAPATYGPHKMCESARDRDPLQNSILLAAYSAARPPDPMRIHSHCRMSGRCTAFERILITQGYRDIAIAGGAEC